MLCEHLAHLRMNACLSNEFVPRLAGSAFGVGKFLRDVYAKV